MWKEDRECWNHGTVYQVNSYVCNSVEKILPVPAGCVFSLMNRACVCNEGILWPRNFYKPKDKEFRDYRSLVRKFLHLSGLLSGSILQGDREAVLNSKSLCLPHDHTSAN